MNIKDYAERNREAWNQVHPVRQPPLRQKQKEADLKEAVKSESFSVLSELEISMFEKLSVKQKNVAQLCCNNGRELISIVKLGATYGVGFDISDEAIKEAILLGSLANTNCEFIRTNIYDIEEKHFNNFDIIYITIGTLCWFDDLDRFFHIVSLLLRQNGYLFIYEIHPYLGMIASPGQEAYDAQHELEIAYSYFKSEVMIDTNGLDALGTSYETKTSYSFTHTISEIFTGILKNNLTILEFNEYPHDISLWFKYLEKYQKLPLSYTLVAQKRSL